MQILIYTAFKKKIVYNEIDVLGILKEADFQMYLNKSCILMELTVSDLLRTLPAAFCTSDSIRTITNGLISDPAYAYE